MQIVYNIVMGAIVLFLVWEWLKYKRAAPKLTSGERIAVVPKEHSNVTVVRKGDSVILTDEKLNELDVNKIVR